MPGKPGTHSLARLAPCAAAILAGAFLPLQAGAAESAYTRLYLDKCQTLKRYEESGGFDLKCEGYEGVPVFVSEGDARMSVAFGAEPERFETFGPFSTLGETVEWRTAGGVPFAAIVRFHLDRGVTGGAEDRADALVISKVGRDGAPGCVTAVVDAALEQANGVARGAAAFSPRHACGTDAPVMIAPSGSIVDSMGSAVAEGQ